jgi:glycosyltransferase involved in cell wall biosynthesis
MTTDTAVIHICEALGGGVLRVVAPLANETAARGVRTSVVHGRRPETPVNLRAHFDDDVRLIEVPGWGDRAVGRSIRSMLRAGRILKRELASERSPGVLHVHSTYAGIIGRVVRAPGWHRFYTPHGYLFLNPSKPAAVRWFARCCEISLGRRGRTLACSQTEGDLAARLVGRERVSVVRNGIDTEGMSVLPATRGHKFVVASIGRAVFQRRPDLVAAAARVLRNDPEVEVQWIGDGPDRPSLMAAGVAVSGWVEEGAVITALGEVDVVLHLSAFEGLPFALLEAMAAGRPVVASDLPVVREVLADTGLLVSGATDAAAAVLRLKADPSLCKRLALAAEQRVRRFFTRAQMIEGTLAAYGLGDDFEVDEPG